MLRNARGRLLVPVMMLGLSACAPDVVTVFDPTATPAPPSRSPERGQDLAEAITSCPAPGQGVIIDELITADLYFDQIKRFRGDPQP